MSALVDSGLKLDRLQAYLHRLRDHAPGADLWADDQGQVFGRVLDADIGSRFQPICSIDGQVRGAQALAIVRPAGGADATDGADPAHLPCAGGAQPTPRHLFDLARSPDELVMFDRRCRTVHTLNFFRNPQAPRDLFLRVHDRLLTAVAESHGRAFKRLLDTLGLPASRVVIELPPTASPHTALLAHVIANYRLAGFRVALNPTSLDEIHRALEVARLDFLRIDMCELDRFDHPDSMYTEAQRVAEFRALKTPILACNLVGDEQMARAQAIGASLFQKED